MTEQPRLRSIPCTIARANDYVRRYHRHHGPLPSARWCLAVVDESGMVRGVAIVGRAKARILDAELVAEVNRVCTDGCPNACSFLYGACRRAAREMGFARLVTYILESEAGTSLRASGWKCDGAAGGGDWFRPNQHAKGRTGYRHVTSSLEVKQRWSIDLNPEIPITWPDAESDHTQLELDWLTEDAS